MVHTQESAPMNWVSQIPDRIPVRILDIVLDQDKAICHPAWEWVRHRCKQKRNYLKSNQVLYQEQDKELSRTKVNSDLDETVLIAFHVPYLDRKRELCFWRFLLRFWTTTGNRNQQKIYSFYSSWTLETFSSKISKRIKRSKSKWHPGI